MNVILKRKDKNLQIKYKLYYLPAETETLPLFKGISQIPVSPKQY